MKTIFNPGMVEHTRFGRLFLGSTFNFSSQSSDGPWLKLSNNRYGLLLPGPTKNKRDSIGVPTMTGRYRYAAAPGGTILSASSQTVVKTSKKSTVWSSVPYGPVTVIGDPVAQIMYTSFWGSETYNIQMVYDPVAKTVVLTWNFPGNSNWQHTNAAFGLFIEKSTTSSEMATPPAGYANTFPGNHYTADSPLYQIDSKVPLFDADWTIPDGNYWWPQQYLYQYPVTQTFSNVDLSVAPYFVAYRLSYVMISSLIPSPPEVFYGLKGVKVDYPVVGLAGGQVLSGSNNTISWTTPASHGQLPWK